MRVENLTDTTFEDLFFIVLRNATDRMDDPDEMYSSAQMVGQYLDLQRQDPTTHVWVDLTFRPTLGKSDHDRLPRTGIAQRETLTFQLRLRISNAIPLRETSNGSIVVHMLRPEADGRCKLTVGRDSFRIHKPRTSAGNGIASTPGSSSAFPWLALAGGAAVTVGGGAVYAVRRRRSDQQS
ncbi:hypothetical protein EAO75_16385 [Streptomyces sp. uw30]|nr:hypothetical protein EAO75_16385 [Streptomyces sp. uw30]